MNTETDKKTHPRIDKYRKSNPWQLVQLLVPPEKVEQIKEIAQIYRDEYKNAQLIEKRQRG